MLYCRKPLTFGWLRFDGFFRPVFEHFASVVHVDVVCGAPMMSKRKAGLVSTHSDWNIRETISILGVENKTGLSQQTSFSLRRSSALRRTSSSSICFLRCCITQILCCSARCSSLLLCYMSSKVFLIDSNEEWHFVVNFRQPLFPPFGRRPQPAGHAAGCPPPPAVSDAAPGDNKIPTFYYDKGWHSLLRY